MAYHHDYADFGAQIMRGAGLTEHVKAIAERAKTVAETTAPKETGEFAASFVAETRLEDYSGVRVVGVLGSTDPKAEFKEFANPDPAQDRTMNKAMRVATG